MFCDDSAGPDELARRVSAVDLCELTLKRVFVLVLHPELHFTAVLMELALHDNVVHHVAEDAMNLFKLERALASVRASLICESPSVDAFFTEGTLTRSTLDRFVQYEHAD